MKILDFFKKKKPVKQEITEETVSKLPSKRERKEPFSLEKKLLAAKKDGYDRNNILYSKYVDGQILIKSEASAECEILDVVSDNGILSIIIDHGKQENLSDIHQETMSSAGSKITDTETTHGISTSKATKVSFIRNQEELFSYLMEGHQDLQGILNSLRQIEGENHIYADLFEKYAIKLDAQAQKKLQEEKYKETKPLNYFLDSYLQEEDKKAPKEDIDYNQEYSIHHSTGGDWREFLEAEGKPIVKDGEVVGGLISAKLSYQAGSLGDTRRIKAEEVSLERWQSFAHRSIVYEEERKGKEKEKQKELAQTREVEAYKEAHPLNYFLDSYLQEGDKKAPKEDIDYNQEYSIHHSTGGDWREFLEAEGKPIVKDGEVVGGLISAKLSYQAGSLGDTRKIKAEEVSLERWQSFAHRSIVYEEERKSKEKMQQRILSENLNKRDM